MRLLVAARPAGGWAVAALALVLCLALALAACGDDPAPPTITVAPPATEAATTPDAPPAETLRVGMVANVLGADDPAAAQARVRELGVRWIREELPWADVEATRGADDWSRFDALMEGAAERGLRVLPLLLSTPAWAGPAPLALPDDPAAFGAFAGRAAARYGPGGAFWRERPRLDADLAPRWMELWNEPWFERFSEAGIDPARYGRMVSAALEAGRAANPRVRWLMAAEQTYETAAGERRSWLDDVLADQPHLAASVDGVAIHPYSFFAPGDADSTGLAFRYERLDAIADRLVRDGGRSELPVWITEIGWSTCSLRPDCVSEPEQAQRLADVFTRALGPGADRVQAVFVYHLRDFAGRPEDDREAHYGVLRADGSRKPAWDVVQDAARIAGSRRP